MNDLWAPGDKFYPTTPGTQVQISGKMWCAGHGRLPWWLHRAGHRLHLLRTKQPPKLRYIDGR